MSRLVHFDVAVYISHSAGHFFPETSQVVTFYPGRQGRVDGNGNRFWVNIAEPRYELIRVGDAFHPDSASVLRSTWLRQTLIRPHFCTEAFLISNFLILYHLDWLHFHFFSLLLGCHVFSWNNLFVPFFAHTRRSRTLTDRVHLKPSACGHLLWTSNVTPCFRRRVGGRLNFSTFFAHIICSARHLEWQMVFS